jgi:hypothetical protein
MSNERIFEASAESKAQAKQLRLFALLAWFVAMAGQVYAILKLMHDETMMWLIAAIVGILVLAVTGSWLWKKANRLDPASEKDKTRFFIQNQLGAILGVLAFLPMVIVIFTNKEMSGKTKGIAGSIAVVAMLLAGITGIDFNPPSIEKYTKEINVQTQILKDLNVADNVYWSPSGNKYHLSENCQHISGREGVTNGTVKESWEKKGISELCKTCENKAVKAQEKPLPTQ